MDVCSGLLFRSWVSARSWLMEGLVNDTTVCDKISWKTTLAGKARLSGNLDIDEILRQHELGNNFNHVPPIFFRVGLDFGIASDTSAHTVASQ